MTNINFWKILENITIDIHRNHIDKYYKLSAYNNKNILIFSTYGKISDILNSEKGIRIYFENPYCYKLSEGFQKSKYVYETITDDRTFILEDFNNLTSKQDKSNLLDMYTDGYHREFLKLILIK